MARGSEEEGENPREMNENKVRRIYIWRAEVRHARKFCQCSRPTGLPPKPPGSSDKGKNVLLTSTSSTAVESDNRPESSLQQADEPSTPFPNFPPAILDRDPFDDEPLCPVCSLPIGEGLQFAELREQGEAGLINNMISSRSAPSHLKNMAEVHSVTQRLRKGRRARFKRQVSRHLRRLKIEAAQHAGEAKEKVKKQAMRVVRPILKLFGKKDPLPPHIVLIDRGLRPRATEMYMRYRPDYASLGDTANDLLSAIDDDDSARGRPKLTVDETADRLRRAQRLLDRMNRSTT
ncbi:uncharacterized protein F4822DRAFT_433574 [Hypoxylon trugodes]|uniref:uncharacterized protein n=1 Tax=Hypoxylon trugodes TaxID=326681 RepID=UPI00219AB72E|nr:uncharacterized protein F4822DRAFT_433574 [Hypoxylon trugodes]KAI1385047.1 hypothetical protein F4822DRAFT_433574 [Hypoxylon trugodes]